MLNAGMVLNGRYEILGVIGKGGMSTVYQARDLTNGNLLAIKDVERTGKEGNQVVEQSLATEGRMLMRLSNNHLPRIYDVIEESDHILMVMDFIRGESLDKVIAREGAQPMDRVLDWGMQICEVFDYLHSQSTPIIYRDMKPANVILQPDGHLMMIDFGTARTEKVGVSMQADTICIGTAGFAAPEQFGGIGQSTSRTDIFCLGATLYNMITGHSPCDRPQGILPLETWNASLANSPISQIIYKCTRNDPDERYQTAMELYQDLQRARNGTFRSPAQQGKSGFGGNAWQKQRLKTNGSVGAGLSGLLGKSGLLPGGQNKSAAQSPVQTNPAPVNSGWQAVSEVPPADYYNNYYNNPYETMQLGVPTPQTKDQTWRKLILIATIISVLMLAFSVVLILLSQLLVGLILLMVAVGAAVLAVLGVVMIRWISP